MGEKNLDFDTVTDRRNTKCLKYDFAVERGKPEDILPFWVADMDFKTSSYIIEALEQMSSHGIYGYSESKESYFKTVQKWLRHRHGWEVEESWLIKTPGVVFALAMAIRAFTKVGEAVLIQQPVYYPFKEVIVDNDRKLVINELKQSKSGRYEMDFADFEQKILSNKVKLFILCSPHNPVGRVWTKEELTKIGEICLKHNVLVVSDEIHADFVFKGKHTVFGAVKKEFEEISIICTSPSKTFNIAGLQVSNIFIANQDLRKKFQKELAATGYSQLNLAGLTAAEAAYQYGETWIDAVLSYIKENADYTRAFLQKYLPKVKMTELEGTYLVWLDFRAYELCSSELDKRITEEAGLWLDGGEMFGRGGMGFQRINIACPRSVLIQGLERLAAAFDGL